jgi:hypothetical protein
MNGAAETAASKDQRIKTSLESGSGLEPNFPSVQGSIAPWLLLGVAVTEFRRGGGEFRARLPSTRLRHDCPWLVAIARLAADETFEAVDV